VRSSHSKKEAELNSSNDVFGNAPDMLSVLCLGFPARFLFVA